MERLVSLAVEMPSKQEQRQGWLPVFAFNRVCGLIAGIDGTVTDLVQDFDWRCNKRSYTARAGALKSRFGRVLRDGRPFQVFLRFRPRPLRVHYGVDATFDQDGWPLCLRTEAECRRLIRNRPDAIVLRQSRASGQWRRVSRLCKGHIWKGR